MSRSILCACILLLSYGSLVKGRVLGSEVERVVTGHLYELDTLTGQHGQLARRHLVDAARPRNLRLALRSEGATFDMELMQESVWSQDSKVMVRRGEDLEEIPVDMEASCFLAGPVSSEKEGYASLDLCDGLSGIIQTRGVSYLIEDAVEEDDRVRVSVRVVTSDLDTLEMMGDDEEEDDMTMDEMEAEEEKFFEMGNDNSTVDQEGNPMMRKRAISNIAAEVGVYVDNNFYRYMKRSGKGSTKQITSFMVKKWNLVKQVYGNRKRVGVKFNIQLKYLEVWEKNPAFYVRVQNDQKMGNHLKAFCRQHKGMNSLDHKMLYTYGVGGAVMGVAYVGGICKTGSKCSVVKGKFTHVVTEVHEFGHNLGFKHEPRMQPCELPPGFMGWSRTTKFQDCYRRFLLKTIGQASRSCLRKTNVNMKVLN